MNHLPENFLEHALSIDDTFQFHCNQCGECCKHREDILISPFDLFRLTRYLNMKPTEFVDRYCTTYIGQNSRLPVVIFKAVGEEQVCPMLQDNHCSVHAAKPTICALYPLGRAVRVEPDGKPEVFYFLNGSTCGAEDETHTVREWLSEFDLQDSNAWFLAWQKAISRLSPSLKTMEKLLPPKELSMLYAIVFKALYLDYADVREFLPKFVLNVQSLQKQIDTLIDKLMPGGNANE